MTDDIYLTPAQLAGLAGMPSTRHGVQMRAAREGWARRRAAGRHGGGGYEYRLADAPAETQADYFRREIRLSREPGMPVKNGKTLTDSNPSSAGGPAPDEEKMKHFWRRYERAPESMKMEARRRLDAVRSIETLVSQGIGRQAAVEAAAAITGRNAATLRRWAAQVRGCHPADRLAVLLPGYAGRTAKAACSEEAWDVFKAFYLRTEQPSAEACYEWTKKIADARGWRMPSPKTMLRRVRREIPRTVRVLKREGRAALDAIYPAQERDHGVFHALEAVNADCHKLDFFVKFADGTVDRIHIVAWQDIYSGKILAWRLTRYPNAHATLLSFGDLLAAWGIPSFIWLDNGREFAAKLLTGGIPTRYRFKVREDDPLGVFAQLDCEVHWCTPAHGQAKPIERAFRDFCDRIAKHPAFAGAYTGNTPLAKPEDYRSRAVPLATLEKILRQEIPAHNARPGRESAVCAGRSLDEAFNESYAACVIRKTTAEQRALCLLAGEGVTASDTDGAVKIGGNRYWAEPLAELAGRKVMVRFDPENLHGSVRVYELSGRFVCEAPCIAKVGFADQNTAREHARQKKRFRRAVKEQAAAEIRMDVLEAAQLIPDTPPAGTPRPAGVEILNLPTRAREQRLSREEADDLFTAAALNLPKARDVI